MVNGYRFLSTLTLRTICYAVLIYADAPNDLLRCAYLGGIYSMLSLNLLPQRSSSKPQAEWLLHRRLAEPCESQSGRPENYQEREKWHRSALFLRKDLFVNRVNSTIKASQNGAKPSGFAFFSHFISSWPMVTKPVFAAQNSVNPYGILSQNGTICFAVYIFLAKDFAMSRGSHRQ